MRTAAAGGGLSGVAARLLGRRRARSMGAAPVAPPPLEQAPADVLDLLTAQHARVAALLDDLLLRPEAGDRVARVSTVTALVETHTLVEEELVYRRLRERAPAAAGAMDSSHEHHTTVLQLVRLVEAVPASRLTQLTRALVALREVVTVDARLEEEGVFPSLRAAVEPAVLTALAADVDTEQRAALARRRPRGHR